MLRPVYLLLAAVALCGWFVTASACDQGKSAGASAATASMAKGGGACPMSASCPYASCPKGARSAAAVTALNRGGCPAHESATTAVTAEMGGSCAAHGAKTTAVTAGMNGSCAGHGARASAVTAGSSAGCWAHGAKASAATAGAMHSCGRADAATAGSVSCPSHVAGAAGLHHAGCAMCDEMSACDQEMRSLGAVTQVVSLKNGVMFVYTAEPSKVRSVQTAMARRKDQMAVFASAGDKTHLCDECRALRGAAASGKLSREVVNIDGGCLTLMTSSDPAVVARIHELAGLPGARVKS
jgi:hypothetical protein